MSIISKNNKLEVLHGKYGLAVKMALHLLQIQTTWDYIIALLFSPTSSPQKRLSLAVSLIALAAYVHVIDLH